MTSPCRRSARGLMAAGSAVVAVGLALAGLIAPAGLPADAQVPGAVIDPNTLISEQPLRSWQVTDLQPAADSSMPDWDVLVWDFAELNGVMYVGGRFQTVRQYSGAPTYAQPFLAAFDVSTGQWISSFRPVIDDGVYALAASPDGNRLLVGGEFSTVNGVPLTSGFAALDPFTGAPDPNFKASFTREVDEHLVKTIEVTDDHIYVGGRFSHVEGQVGGPTRRYSLARLDGATGALDSTWEVPVNGGKIMGMELSPDESELYLGGFFTTIGETVGTKWMGMIRTAEQTAVAFADPVPPANNFYVFDVEVSDTKVFAASERHHLMMWDRSDLTMTHDYFSSGYGGDYQALVRSGDVLWAGGHHHGYEQNNLGDRTRRQVQWLSPYYADTGEPIIGWVARIGMRDGVFSLATDSEGKLWVGGDPTAAGTVPVRGFAVFPNRSAQEERNLARNQASSQSSRGESGLNWRNKTSEARCNNAKNDLVGPAGAAVDGKTTAGAWECSFSVTQLETDPWWQVDLGEEGEIDMVRIWNMFSSGDPEDLSDVWIAVSSDPMAIDSTDPVAMAADPLVTIAQIPGQVPWFKELPIGRFGRYVRVFLDSQDPVRLRVPELEVLDLPGVSPPPPVDEAAILVAPDATWKYFDGGAPPAGWNDLGFDDGAWGQGPALLGFGDADIATVTAGGQMTTYLRHQFQVNDPAAIAGLTLELLADDGAVAYLNGVELHRLRMPAGPVGPNTKAADTVWGAAERAWTSVAVPSASLVEGSNVLAVEVHNNWSGGGDVTGAAALLVSDQVVVPPAVDQVLIALDSEWRYLDTGVEPDATWTAAGFDDAAWPVGTAQLGYGDGDEATVVAEGPVPDRHITTWFRTTFDLADPGEIDRLDLDLIRDDGAVVYINGVEQVRTNMAAGPVNGSTLASDYAWGPGEEEPQRFSVGADILEVGTNTVAVEIHSASRGSRDLSFALEVIGVAS